MGFRLNTNTAALSAHTSATMNNRNLDSSLSKLSSGLRINKAADDASGLAIANSLRSQASSLGQAIANGNDAVGLIQTADGALSEYSNILDTIKTKATQAASDTQNTSTRQAIQKDIEKLMKELNTIAETTSFNGQKLLSGAFSNKEFQMGASANQSVSVNIASAQTSQIGQTTKAELNLASEEGGVAQLTLTNAKTNESVQLKSVDIKANNDPQNGMGQLAIEINKFSNTTGVSAKAVVSSTSGSAVQAGSTGDFSINGVAMGDINVTSNDGDGTLLSAINSKSTNTGVSATLTESGHLTLTSNDGRAIKVEGDLSSVLGSSSKDMSTIGHLELTQSGASAFKIEGLGAGAVTNQLTTTASSTTIVDSKLSSGSTITASSVLKAGSVTGGDIKNSADVTTVIDSTIVAGSILASGSTVETGTTIGGKMTLNGAQTLTQDSYVTTGSTLKSGSILGIGSVIQQDFTDGANSFTKGQVLNASFTLTADLTLTSDMTLKFSATGGQNTSLALGSTLQAGTVVGADIVQKSDTAVTLSQDMVLKANSILKTSSTLLAGSEVGGDFIVNADTVTYQDTELKAASFLTTGTILKEGSTVGATLTVGAIAAGSFTDDMQLKAGSTIAAGTIIAAGTVLSQDLTAAQTGSSDMKAGDVLSVDMTTGAAVTLNNDMVLKGSTTATLAAGSKIATNTTNAGSVGISNTSFENLSDIDVTTMKGAMKAIDLVSAAITDLDTIRSDLGSTQNQIVSTINNISTTQVNVKAAESAIRDVDFAAESANFSKFNIMAQAGSYAMSQANSVQQNVMRLLQ